MYGWYSKAAVENDCDSFIYLTPTGDKIEVTCVTRDEAGAAYTWCDKKLVGEVVKHVKTIKSKKAKLRDETTEKETAVAIKKLPNGTK